MVSDEVYEIEIYSIRRFIGNVKNLKHCKRNANITIYQNIAYEDLELVGMVNNFTKALNPVILHEIYKNLGSHRYDEALITCSRLLTKTSILKRFI